MESMLRDKELGILELIAKNRSISQRDLSHSTGISLGLINVILKKLIQGGFLKAAQFNKRKLEYLLTPVGNQEATKKNYRKASQAIKNYHLLQSNMAELLKNLHSKGYDYFSIYGNGELRQLLEEIFKKSLQEAPVTLGNNHKEDPRAVVLNVSTEPLEASGFKGDVVNVLEKIGL